MFSSIVSVIGNDEGLNVISQKILGLEPGVPSRGLGFLTSALFARDQACWQLIGVASPTSGKGS